MKVSGMLGADLGMAPLAIAELERRGYDALFSAEINNDPFFPLVLAAEHSESIALSTSIAVAFARSPMTLAQQAWDLHQYSAGRFTLGLGSQIKQHITRRYSMEWSKPAARMREFVLAMRAIWNCWETGEKLNFEGEFYRHNLMTPMFTPPDKGYGAPGVMVAGVGPLMTETAAEVGDGLVAHGFTSQKYLQEVTLPAVQRGLEKAGRERGDFNISCPVMVVSGYSEEAFEQNLQAIRAQIGFYTSTPAYRSVLELHGWGDLQAVANQYTRDGRWGELAGLIDDEMLNAFALVCEDPAHVPEQLFNRYGGLVDTWQCTFETGDTDRQQELITQIQEQGD